MKDYLLYLPISFLFVGYGELRYWAGRLDWAWWAYPVSLFITITLLGIAMAIRDVYAIDIQPIDRSK